MQATQEFVALPPVVDISAPHLTASESAALLECINQVRTGQRVYLVRLVNRKLRKPDGSYKHGRKRVAGEDYVADPALAPDAHEGILYAAPTNKRGEVYIRVLDGARRPPAPDDEDAPEYGFTCASMEGLRSFRVLAEFPGPLAQPEPVAAGLNVGPQPQPSFDGFNPQALMALAMSLQATAAGLQAQAVALQAQAAALMAQAMSAQAQQKQPSSAS